MGRRALCCEQAETVSSAKVNIDVYSCGCAGSVLIRFQLKLLDLAVVMAATKGELKWQVTES
jgi:hypothetical protein